MLSYVKGYFPQHGPQACLSYTQGKEARSGRTLPPSSAPCPASPLLTAMQVEFLCNGSGMHPVCEGNGLLLVSGTTTKLCIHTTIHKASGWGFFCIKQKYLLMLRCWLAICRNAIVCGTSHHLPGSHSCLLSLTWIQSLPLTSVISLLANCDI